MSPEKTIEVMTKEGDKARIHIYARGVIVERGDETCAFWAGIRVPDWLIQKSPKEIDAREFFRLKSPAVRSRFVSRLGIKRILSSLDGRIVERSADCDLIVFNDGKTRRPYLRDKRRIDPWRLEELDASIKTVKEALDWMERGQEARRKERAWRGLHY